MLLALHDVIESASGLVTIDDEEMREFINADVETIKETDYYKSLRIWMPPSSPMPADHVLDSGIEATGKVKKRTPLCTLLTGISQKGQTGIQIHTPL